MSGDDGNTVSWRELLAETTDRLEKSEVEITSPGAEARWIVAEASGCEGAELELALDDPATVRGVSRLDDMTARRLSGEPIQYVLGRWAFRSLDLMCDRRVLIPRPETEQVVGHALDELDRVLLARPVGHHPTVVDLGTGSGAIGLSMALERPGTDVVMTDVSPDAVAVASANLTGLGMAGSRVQVLEGNWYGALPARLEGEIDLLVSNPPYVAEDEVLPPSVADWEPSIALLAGSDGLNAYRLIVAGAQRWLAADGTLVLEIGADQAEAVRALVLEAGFSEVLVHSDHAGLARTLVARLAPV